MESKISSNKNNSEVKTKTLEYGEKVNQYEEKDFNSEVVFFLKEEENKLRKNLDICLNRNDTAMYRNLIQAYERVVELIKKYDWQLRYSKYFTTDGKQVAVWEQNGDGQIRNHKVWNIK